jgi:phosphonopyruvate decarboxylase
MIKANDILSAFISRGYIFFIGVPCSFLTPLIDSVIQSGDLDYVAAASEGEAVGIAAGAYLAGQKTTIMCQNSGLGNMINPLTSLSYPFRIPSLLIVTLRGQVGIKDEPQHELMGRITGTLLDAISIPWTFFPSNTGALKTVLSKAEEEMMANKLPFALVIKKGDIYIDESIKPEVKKVIEKPQGLIIGEFDCKLDDRMSRMQAIKVISEMEGKNAAIIASTGKIGREMFTLKDYSNQLYVVGSMGCASGIGFGVQHILPKQRVVVLDGDGAALMKMGTIATIGYYRSNHLVHIILDNETYESTGGQHTSSVSVDFSQVAYACGYQRCYRVDTKKKLSNAILESKKHIGPTIIHVKVKNDSKPNLGRPNITPAENKERFIKFIGSNY